MFNFFFVLMFRRPPRSTRTDTLFPYTTLFRSTKCYDINGDGTDDIEVALTPSPTCVNWQNIQNSSLDLSDADDAACATGATQQFGVEGAPTGNSLCANSMWEITAQSSDKEIGRAHV